MRCEWPVGVQAEILMLNLLRPLSGLLLLATTPLAAQSVPIAGDSAQQVIPTMKLGDGTISGTRVKPFQAAWHATFYPEGSAPTDGGMWLQQLQVANLDGRKVLVRTTGGLVYGHKGHEILGYVAHVAVLDPDTLAPIWSQHRDFDGSIEKWIVNGTHVEWHRKGADPTANEEVRTFDTPMPAYDFAGAIIPFFLGAQSLKLGYSGVIPEIGDPEHPLRGLPFKVIRRERVKAGARGMVDAWVVECPDPTTGTLQFWISEKVPFPIRMVIPAIPGHPRQVYEMIG
jgi:hypothetical protein